MALDAFFTNLINCFGLSNDAKSIFKHHTKTSFPSHKGGRWWSKFDVLKHQYDMFAHLTSIVQEVRTYVKDFGS